MNKKTALSIVISTALGVSSIASADTISMSFGGMLTLVGGTGAINGNSDAAVSNVLSGPFDAIGSRTPVSGIATFDTSTGAGIGHIDSFSFFGNGLASGTVLSFQAIGDGFGSTDGTLVAAEWAFNWSGYINIPVTAIFDAAGFFNSIGSAGSTWTVGTGCTGCATSATPDTFFTGLDEDYPEWGHVMGDQPMAMTTWDTAGITMGTLFPLSDDPDRTDGVTPIAGSPMTTAPFIGQNMAFDFTSITATNTTVVPVPTAAWLFGSGLIGLIGMARRKA